MEVGVREVRENLRALLAGVRDGQEIVLTERGSTRALADATGDAAEQYELRSHDAIQLASATEVLDRELVVATWDRDLHHAAVEAGLAVAP